jgi:hypothetical protein
MEPSRREFRTKRLAFASFLHAARSLPYLGATNSDDGRVAFIFQDEQSLGPQLEMEFDAGANVPAIRLFSSQTYLRRQIAAAQIGEPRNVQSSHTRR